MTRPKLASPHHNIMGVGVALPPPARPWAEPNRLEMGSHYTGTPAQATIIVPVSRICVAGKIHSAGATRL